MSRRSILFGIVLLLVGFTNSDLEAQRSISVDEAIKIALEQNNQIRRAKSTLTLQEIGVTQAKATFLPNLFLSGNPGVNWGLGFDQTVGELVTERSERFNATLSSGINLFNGFSDRAGLDQAKLNLESAEFDFERMRQNVVFNVISSYLNLIVNREQIGIQEQNLESQNQLLARIEEFVRVGSRPESDLFQQQFASAQSESNLLNAQRLYEISQANLISILELDPLQDYDFTAPNSEDLVIIPGDYQLSTLLQEAAERRLDLQASKLQIEAADQGSRFEW